MRFSKWQAYGNVYLLTEQSELSPEEVRSTVGDADGIMQVLSVEGDEAEVVIWNPDGSTAELSGNGTRIAARWLARRSGEDAVRIRVGQREVSARLQGHEVELDVGEVTVGEPETLDVGEELEFTPVSVGNPHAVIQLVPN